jgi:uncharacterized protein YjbI with pentapeptide repeats
MPPRFLDDPAFKFLRSGDLTGFQQVTENRQTIDLSGADLRGVDFRNVDLRKLLLRDAYLRDADLRGCDLRHLDLSGASIQGARVSGTYFPQNVDAGEIQLSLQFGTRIRTQSAR